MKNPEDIPCVSAASKYNTIIPITAVTATTTAATTTTTTTNTFEHRAIQILPVRIGFDTGSVVVA